MLVLGDASGLFRKRAGRGNLLTAKIAKTIREVRKEEKHFRSFTSRTLLLFAARSFRSPIKLCKFTCSSPSAPSFTLCSSVSSAVKSFGRIRWAPFPNGGFMKNILFGSITVATVLIALALCPNLRPTVTAGNTVNADTLRQLEAEFMKAAAEKGSQGYMSYYADDAVEVPNGAAIIQGKANISKGMSFLDQKDNQLTWTPVGADVSASGDLGYTYGNYESHSKDKEGKPIVEHGKYTSIW